MAKLAANGQEVFRLEKKAPTARYQISIRSNRWVLSKLHVYIESSLSPAYWHDYGWKRKGKTKAGFTLEQVRDAYRAKGYEVTYGR